jgi:two-component system response regulator GlrR
MSDQIKRNVLIVDDDPTIRGIVRMQLKSAGICLLEATDTASALNILEGSGADAVLCDIKLKNENGFDVFREIRKVYPALPIIILTGFIEEEYYDTSKDLGVANLLIKPIRKEKLLEALEKVFI